MSIGRRGKGGGQGEAVRGLQDEQSKKDNAGWGARYAGIGEGGVRRQGSFGR